MAHEIDVEINLATYKVLAEIAAQNNIPVEELIVEIIREQLEKTNEICESN